MTKRSVRALLWCLTAVVPAACGETPRAPASPAPMASGDSSVYAWLLNGDHHAHHVDNIRQAAAALVRLGVPPTNIVISSEGGRPRRTPRSNFGVANRQNLRLQQSLLKHRLDGSSTLIVYLTGHGGKGQRGSPTNTSVALHRSHVVRAEAFLVMIDRELNCGRLVLVIDACYSGGFVKTFESIDCAYTGMSPTDEKHQTSCQPFSPLFWNRLAATNFVGIEAGFRGAIAGCRTFQRFERCPHGRYACSSYGRRHTYRHRLGRGQSTPLTN